MTQNTQTTVERIKALLIPHPFDDFELRTTIRTIAAEIDRLTAERDEARERSYALERESQSRAMIDASTIAILRAEVERLRPAAEAWAASRFYHDLMSADAADPTADGYRPVTDDEIIAASDACQKADARARAAKVTP